MEIVDYLNNTIFCKLAPSLIAGVGVFAIRDIPKGTKITDYQGGTFKYYSLTDGEFKMLLPEIQTLIKQQTIFGDNGILEFDSPNSHQILEIFMNHSEEPNSDGLIATRDIKAGEEVTKRYDFIKGLNSDILEI